MVILTSTWFHQFWIFPPLEPYCLRLLFNTNHMKGKRCALYPSIKPWNIFAINICSTWNKHLHWIVLSWMMKSGYLKHYAPYCVRLKIEINFVKKNWQDVQKLCMDSRTYCGRKRHLILNSWNLFWLYCGNSQIGWLGDCTTNPRSQS